MEITEDKKARYSIMASIVSAFMISVIFLALALLKNSARPQPLYSQVDMLAGMLFVFILSMIVSVSLWPAIMDRYLGREER